MRLDTFEDVAALSAADALSLGYEGNSEQSRAERDDVAYRLITEFGHGRLIAEFAHGPDPNLQQDADQLVIAEAVWRNGGDIIGALDELERAATRDERPALTVEQVAQLRDEVVAPMPGAITAQEVAAITNDLSVVRGLQVAARQSTASEETVTDWSRSQQAFLERWGFPESVGREVLQVERYLRDERAHTRPERVGQAAAAAATATAAAREALDQAGRRFGQRSPQFAAVEMSVDRLQSIADRIDVTSYAQWRTDGRTLYTEEVTLDAARDVQDRRAGRGLTAAAFGGGAVQLDPRQLVAAATFNIAAIEHASAGQVTANESWYELESGVSGVDVFRADQPHDPYDPAAHVRLDTGGQVRVDLVGFDDRQVTGANLRQVSLALGVNETDTAAVVQEAAHQLQRGQVAYDAADASRDIDAEVQAFDQEHGQSAREALQWHTTGNQPTEQEQTMTPEQNTHPGKIDANRLREPGSENEAATMRPDVMSEQYPDEDTYRPGYDDGPVTSGPAGAGDDVSIRVNDDGGVHATDGTADRSDAVMLENEPDVDEMVNLGLVDDRVGARQGQDRSNPAEQRVDMQAVQDNINAYRNSLDGAGVGHDDRYGYDNTQPTQADDPTIRA